MGWGAIYLKTWRLSWLALPVTCRRKENIRNLFFLSGEKRFQMFVSDQRWVVFYSWFLSVLIKINVWRGFQMEWSWYKMGLTLWRLVDRGGSSVELVRVHTSHLKSWNVLICACWCYCLTCGIFVCAQMPHQGIFTASVGCVLCTNCFLPRHRWWVTAKEVGAIKQTPLSFAALFTFPLPAESQLSILRLRDKWGKAVHKRVLILFLSENWEGWSDKWRCIRCI